MRHILKHKQICSNLGIDSLQYERHIVDMYKNKNMSGIEISEYIKQNFNIDISPRSIQRTVAKSGLTRGIKEAYNLAIKRGRVTWAYKEYKHKRKKLNPKLRYDILQRDNFRCIKCGNTAITSILEVDHIIPLCKNGLTVKENLQTLCYECNHGKLKS